MPPMATLIVVTTALGAQPRATQWRVPGPAGPGTEINCPTPQRPAIRTLRYIHLTLSHRCVQTAVQGT